MKFKAILFSLLCMAMTALYAAPVSPSVAMQVASNFYAVNAGKSGSVSLTDVTSQSGFQEFYIFVHPQGKGFVIVAADDCVQPIIGYSLSTSFVFPLPAHVQAQLQGYEEEIAYYKSAGIRATSEIIDLWESMQNGSYTPRNTTSVSPMLTTTWNQSPYYNNLCPDSAGVHAVTGCAATATAQVMKYWNWPVTGTGSHTYTDDNFGTLTANFGATTYNWSMMPNALNSQSTTAQVNAVATLMFHVGVAIEMDYGIHSSGAYTNSYGYSDLACSENALKDYFGYKSTIHSVYKENTTDAVWISVLTSELDAGRPVIEAGHGGGGHAFVCDGYDNNGLFHINWGWGSAYDGYFAHNALNPGGGGTGSGSMGTYNQDQSLVVGIEPAGLHTSTQYLTLPQEGGTTSFTVSSNVSSTTSWTASCNQPWLTVSPITGYGSGVTTTVNVTATANNTGAVRQALVTITQGTQSATVTVSQSECASSDMCQITLEMNDSYGDGWNSSYLTLSSPSGYVYGTATLSDGSYATQQFSVCPSGLILSWTSGSQWDDECSFTVYNSSNQVLLTASGPFNSSYTINTPCAGGTQPPTTCEVTTFPWNESFEGSLDCWSVIDADGDGNVWGRTTSSPYDGNYTLYSFSYDNDNNVALNAENYLVSPQITLPATGNYQLNFYARCANDNYPDSLWVKLSTTGSTNASAFNTILMQKTVVPAAYQQYTINLSDYNGQSFYLAFVHDSYDGYYLLLDNISIVNTSQSYTITATSANNAMGTVTGGGSYSAGSEVTLEVTANPGYRFTGWNDGNTDNPRTFTAMANASYTAYFADLGTNELHYDNGTLANSMGAGGTLYWAVRFPANVLSSYTTLSSVRLWDMYAGSYQVSVCQGGTNAPGTQLASQTFSLNGTEDWYNATLSTPVTINPAQPLWIVLYNTGVSYPAAGSTYAGNPDGSWVSLDGNSWNQIYAYGNFYYTWMVRPVLSSGSTPQTYTITAVSANTSMGEVIGGGSYPAGTTVQLMANAYQGYEFVNWQDGNTSNPRYITVTGNASYTAYFQAVAPSNYTITATSANSAMGTVTGGGTYNSGAEVSLEATANPGYRFTAWNDNVTDNPRTFTAVANASYTAYFADLGTNELHYDNGTLANSMGAGGTLYWAVRFPASVLSSYNTLNSVRIWDQYAGSYHVSVCQGGTNAPGALLASQTFSLNGTGTWFDATFSSPLTIDPTQALWIVLYNTGVDYPAAASTYAGNPDGSWVSLNGNDWNSICNYDYDLTWMIRPVLSAASTPQTYTITAISSNDAMGTVYGGGPYTAGTTVQLIANAAPNHHFVSWNDGNTSNPRYITVTGNATYIANFAVDQYQITVLSANDAMGTVTGGGMCDYGSVVQIQAYPSAGYEFVYWNDGNTDNPRDITVTGNATYVANFQPTVGIDGNNLSAVSVYSHDHQIVVCHAEGKSIEIYDVLGKLVAYDTQNSQELRQFTISTKGIYLVRVGEAFFKKVIVK